MLKIRLSRVGRKNQPFFKIVVIPKSAPPKGGKFKEQIGTHDPVNKETVIDEEKARKWMAQGAKPSDTVHNLFVKHGIMRGRKVAVHDKDPVEPKEEPKEEKKEEPKEEKKEEKKEEPKKEEKEEKKTEDKKEVKKDKEKEEKSEKKEKTEKKEEKETKEEKKEEKKEESKKEEKKTEDKKEAKGLDSLELSTRITNALEDAEIDTLDKLKEKSEEELSEVKGLGKKSIEEIMEKLK